MVNLPLAEHSTIKKSKVWLSIIEIVIILLAALWVGKNYLNFDPKEYVEGGEFTFTTFSHYAWNLLSKCGSCVFWNGYKNGGSPSFVEVHGAFLHPLVFWSSLQFGVINGSKIVILASLFLIGLSTWWLAKELELGFFIRLWASIIMIAGGEIFGRLQTGNVPLVLSIASAGFVLPSVIRLSKAPTKRNIVIVAISLALLVLSGQGYSQIVVILAYFPVLLWYIVKPFHRRLENWKYLFQACLLGLLLISILLVPFVHFMGNWQKPVNPELNSLQPLEYSVLNLVIRDKSFFDNQTLEKNPLPWSNINYIGWIPIILSIIGLFFLKRSAHKRELYLFYLIFCLALLFSSKDPYVLVKNLSFVQQFRFINVGASLAVQPLILIGAITFDELLKIKWGEALNPRLSSKLERLILPVQWVFVLILMTLSIKAPYSFGEDYLVTHHVEFEPEVLELFNTQSAQWVRPQVYIFLPELMKRDSKVITFDKSWSWKGVEEIKPYLTIVDKNSGVDTTGTIKTYGNMSVLEDEAQIYSFVRTDNLIEPCAAKSLGGQIDVFCSTSQAGTLIIREYYWKGWNAWMDGKPVDLEKNSDFLAVPAAEGSHLYQFRYQPWDVWVGMGLTLLGLFICFVLLVRKPIQ